MNATRCEFLRRLFCFVATMLALSAAATPQDDCQRLVELSGDRPCQLREDISQGEQVDNWSFFVNDEKVLSGKSVGHKRIRILDRPMIARRGVRVAVNKGTVSYRLYFVDPELVRLVLSATTESGETDTAKWMTGVEKESR